MKNFIKRSAVATLSVLGILSVMPSAFCAPKSEVKVAGAEGEYYPVLLDGVRSDGSAYFSEGNFTADEFKKVLTNAGIINEEGKYSDEWPRIIEISDYDSLEKGCRVVFKSNDDRLVIFKFGLCGGKLSSSDYNEFLKECGVEEPSILLK